MNNFTKVVVFNFRYITCTQNKMDASFKEIKVIYQNLKRVWDSKSQNLEKAGELLSQLKVIYSHMILINT